MKPTLGMRHAVLWVSEPARSAEFYRQVLGLEIKSEGDRAVFLASPSSATDHDLGLFKTDGPAPPTGDSPDAGAAVGPAVGLYHIAWEVETLTDLVEAKERLVELGALVGENNHGVSRSLYAKDPDGIEFEVMWELPADQIADDEPSNVALDLDADMVRFGKTAPGRGGR